MLKRKLSQGLFGFRLDDLTLKSTSNRSESYAGAFIKLRKFYINI